MTIPIQHPIPQSIQVPVRVDWEKLFGTPTQQNQKPGEVLVSVHILGKGHFIYPLAHTTTTGFHCYTSDIGSSSMATEWFAAESQNVISHII